MKFKKGYASQVDQQPWVSCRWAFEPSCFGSRPWHSSSCPSSRMASCSSSELEPSILSTVPSSPIGLPSSKFLSFFFFFSQIWFGIWKGKWRIISFCLQWLHFVVFGQNSQQWVLRELLLCLRLTLMCFVVSYDSFCMCEVVKSRWLTMGFVFDIISSLPLGLHFWLFC